MSKSMLWIKKYFIGLASPLAALLIACSVLVAAKYASLMTAIPTALTWFFCSLDNCLWDFDGQQYKVLFF